MAKPSVISDYNITTSGLDANGKYAVTDFKRLNNTMYLKSTLTNPDGNGNYQTMTHQFYNATGLSVVKTVIHTLTYDASNNVISITIS